MKIAKIFAFGTPMNTSRNGFWPRDAAYLPSKMELPLNSNAPEGVMTWLRHLRAMVRECSALEPEAARRLELLDARLGREEATVAFGGHFKSGKSTLINSLLGRAILPTGGLPETGAMCVMRCGDEDAAHIHDASGKRDLECHTDAIRHAVSLTAISGARRTQTHDVERLELTLSGAPIKAGARWIDSPGINDTVEMTACASRAASEADVLLWVLNTRQFLSVAEVEFLSDHVARHGQHAVSLVVNAYLVDEDVDGWNEFVREQMPVHGEKLRERAPDIGFEAEFQLETVAVAGRALGLQTSSWGDHFGGTSLLQLMESLSSPTLARIQRARWNRVLIELDSIAPGLEQHWQRDVAELVQLRKALRAQHAIELETATKNRVEFKREVELALHDFQTQWEIAAHACGETLATSIVPPHIWRDDTYSNYLNGALKVANTQTRATLISCLSAACQKWAQTLPGSACLTSLESLLSAPQVGVVVPNTAPPMSVDGVLNSLGLGGQNQTAAFVKARNDALGTQWNVRHVTAYAATAGRANREQAVEAVLANCVGLNERLTCAVTPDNFAGGEVIAVEGIVDTRTADEPAAPSVYSRARRGVFRCEARSLKPNGPCLVRLHFAEPTAKSPDERRFHVEANGKRVLSNYDIFSRAGGGFKSVVEEFAARADAGGKLTLCFERGESGEPLVCAVQIIPQEEVSFRLSPLKMRLQRRRELLRDLRLLREEAATFARGLG